DVGGPDHLMRAVRAELAEDLRPVQRVVFAPLAALLLDPFGRHPREGDLFRYVLAGQVRAVERGYADDVPAGARRTHLAEVAGRVVRVADRDQAAVDV